MATMIVCFITALLACVVGRICGMGGGVIIKPVLDALGVMSVASVSFLSGCTVVGMSCWSVGRSLLRRESQIDLRISTPLAIGAAVGGVLGKELFAAVSALFLNADTAGGVQACLLFAATLATFVYTRRRSRIHSRHVSHPAACVAIGLALGMLGSFLGIGGGPFNMAVLFYFFSMETKAAAQNSLYVILISQATGLMSVVISGSTPPLRLGVLIGMILFGIIGSEMGSRASKCLSERGATVLFEASMLLVMAINVVNICKFLHNS